MVKYEIMTEPIEDRLLPKGKHEVHSQDGAINPTDNLRSAAEKADKVSVEEIESFFTTGNANHQVLIKIPLQDGNVVSEVSPSAPFAEGGVMVCAGNLGRIREGKNATQNIYDFPPDVQKTYWQLVLANLLVLHDLTADTAQYRIVATENTTPRTSEEYRTSRTLPFPHIQINRFDVSEIQPGEVEMPSLAVEQRILRRKSAMQEFVYTLYEKMGQLISRPQIRQAEPYGYTLEFPITTDTALANIDLFQRVMQKHHNAYASQSQEILSGLRESNQRRVIPQPSYRTYVFFDRGNLKTIISPEFLSHAGVTEAAGVQTVRATSILPRFTQEELSALRSDIVSGVQLKLHQF